MIKSKYQQILENNSKEVISFYKNNPDISQIEIAKIFRVTRKSLQRFMYKNNIFRHRNIPKGIKNGRWKNGIIVTGNRRYIYAPNHPRSKKRNHIQESILVMERHIGRYLKSSEVVHHLDNNSLNNNLSNLKLLPNQSEHIKIHLKEMLRKRKDNLKRIK